MGKDTRNLIFANVSENTKHKIPKRKSTKLFTRKIFNSAVLKALNAVNILKLMEIVQLKFIVT